MCAYTCIFGWGDGLWFLGRFSYCDLETGPSSHCEKEFKNELSQKFCVNDTKIC